MIRPVRDLFRKLSNCPSGLMDRYKIFCPPPLTEFPIHEWSLDHLSIVWGQRSPWQSSLWLFATTSDHKRRWVVDSFPSNINCTVANGHWPSRDHHRIVRALFASAQGWFWCKQWGGSVGFHTLVGREQCPDGPVDCLRPVCGLLGITHTWWVDAALSTDNPWTILSTALASPMPPLY